MLWFFYLVSSSLSCNCANMNKTILIPIAIVAFLINVSEGIPSSCPLSSKMTICSPKCKDDTECFGQKCCPNICNTKSCSAPNQQTASSGYKGSKSGGTGTYCGNVKCNSYEKCQTDSSTKRPRCVRA